MYNRVNIIYKRSFLWPVHKVYRIFVHDSVLLSNVDTMQVTVPENFVLSTYPTRTWPVLNGDFRRVRKIAKSDYELRHICPSVRPSVLMEQVGYHWTDCHEIWYLWIFRKSVEKTQVSLKSDNNKEYFTWRPINIFIISRSFLLGVRNVSDKIGRDNQNSLFMFSNFFQNRDICEILWKDIVERGRSQMTIRFMRNACWIPKIVVFHFRLKTQHYHQ
jgi:hypothetical protein